MSSVRAATSFQLQRGPADCNTGNMLAHAELPEQLIKPAVAVLSAMSPNERDLIRVVVEVINELRDSNSDSIGEQTFVRCSLPV